MGIYAIWGPPQSGKTTLAVDLAFALSLRGKSVCLISPELYSELSARLNIRIEPERSLGTVRKHLGTLRQYVHTVEDLLYVLAVSFDHDAFDEDISPDTAKELLREAETSFDAVLVDCPSDTWSALAAWALNDAARVLLLTGAQSSAAMWSGSYRKALTALEGKALSVCAELNDCFDYRGLHTVQNVTPAIWLPFLTDAALLQSQRRTLYQTPGRAGRDYARSMDRLCALLEGGEETP